MFCKKLKNRIKELENYERIYEQRIKNQVNTIDWLCDRYITLEVEHDRVRIERLNESRILTSLKRECLEKGEQINTLQELVNNRKKQGTDNVDELKRTIEKQAAQISRLESFKKRIQEAKKAGKSKPVKNKK